ncbi:four helix bundle protein [Acidobacteria bacterium AB60]|nr:four helix bundle protein [Acidobacteria bacterium AB60]
MDLNSTRAAARVWTQSHRDLVVWQKSKALVLAVYRLTRTFPRDELFGLTNQLRRAAVSIPSNIAEGHGRPNRREFNQFLRIARGSTSELQTQLEIAADLKLGEPPLFKRAEELALEVGKMLLSLLSKVNPNAG